MQCQKGRPDMAAVLDNMYTLGGVLALDLATKLGWAYGPGDGVSPTAIEGPATAKPLSGSLRNGSLPQAHAQQ